MFTKITLHYVNAIILQYLSGILTTLTQKHLCNDHIIMLHEQNYINTFMLH